MELPLDQEAIKNKRFAVTGMDRATVYVAGQAPEDSKQRTNRDDIPLWDIFCTEQDGRQVTNFKVRVASIQRPEIDGIARINFGGLRASTYPDGNRNVVSFTADTFALGDPPSTSVPEPPAPESTHSRTPARKKAA